jgi:uncharacterized protein YuzE
MTIYFDKEADFLEVIFEIGEGYFKNTENENVMEKVSTDGKVLGFSINNVSTFSGLPISVNLHAA